MAEKGRTKTRLEEDRIALRGRIVGMYEAGKNRLVFKLFSIE